MRLTNKTNLPIPLYEALRNDDYTRGEANISATGLIAPARKVALEELHAAELEEDAADKAAILIGKAVHAYIAAKATGDLSDKRRLMMAVNGWVVSGQTDHTDDEMFTISGGRILDYKTTSVNEWKYGLHEERAQQLNIYAEILRANGFNPTGLTAVMIFKDFSATQAQYGGDYPPHSIVEMDVPLWPREQAQAYIMERVLAHQAAQGWICSAIVVGGGPLNRAEVCGLPRDANVHYEAEPCHAFQPFPFPECSDEERWLRDTKWAVMKGGAARATKLHDDKEAATLHATELQAKEPRVPYSVEFRPGTPTRCVHYCQVGAQGLCSQYETWKQQEVNDA